MRIPKVYGQSKANGCFFCGKASTLVNEQALPVCVTHKDAVLGDFKCACGSWLDLREGKWGPYWLCHDCGIINQRKALEFNTVQDVSGKAQRGQVANGRIASDERKGDACSVVQKRPAPEPPISQSPRKPNASQSDMSGYLSPEEFGE